MVSSVARLNVAALVVLASLPGLHQTPEEANSRLREAMDGGWWRRTPTEVRAIWNLTDKGVDCIPLQQGATDCLMLTTDQLECCDSEFRFEGRGSLSLTHLCLAVPTNDATESEAVLRQWRATVAPPAGANYTKGSEDPIEWRYTWTHEGGRFGLALSAFPVPRSNIWQAQLCLNRTPDETNGK